jgi:DNA-binding CsgD family transcriptional regulator
MPQPPFKVTRKLQRKVMLLVAYGLGERGIAHELGIARETLRVHFAHELEVGRAKIQAQVAEWLYSAASKGSVAAMKYLDAKGEGYVMGTARTLGKKEQQLEAAKNAGGDEWGDLLKVEPAVKAN